MSGETQVLDFRSVLEQKLTAKKDELGQTEQNLKKYVRSAGSGRSSNLFRNRLGPEVQTQDKKRLLGSRLGPRVSGHGSDDVANGGGDAARDESPAVRSILSRVVVEQPSRDEALAHKQKNVDKKEVMRNRRMFGSIMGTLQNFVRDENKGKERELKKREIEKKIEKRTEQEKEDAVREKQELVQEKHRKEREIKALQLQMRRVEEFEAWEKTKKGQQGFILTKSSLKSNIYYLPKIHNDSTRKLLVETSKALETEIKAAREIFEDELLKINEKIDNPKADLDEESDDEEENGLHTLSVVSSIAKVSHREPEHHRKRTPPPVRRVSPKPAPAAKSPERNDKKQQKPASQTKAVKRKRRSSSKDNRSSSSDSSSDSEGGGSSKAKGRKDLKRPRKQGRGSDSD